jgi:hypothetical protein
VQKAIFTARDAETGGVNNSILQKHNTRESGPKEGNGYGAKTG